MGKMGKVYSKSEIDIRKRSRSFKVDVKVFTDK